MGVYRGNIFAVDWTNLSAVCRVCNALGRGNVVIKIPGRDNYNITFEDRAIPEQIVYRPRGEQRKRY